MSASTLQEHSDELYARQLAAEEIEGAEARRLQAQAPPPRRHSRWRRREVTKDGLLATRVWMVVLIVLHVVGLAVLLLQLTPPGFPSSMEQLGERLGHSFAHSFWFVPIAAGAAVPLAAAALGAGLMLRPFLWLYCGFLLFCVALRLYFIFEMSQQEGWASKRAATPSSMDQRTLLIDMLLASACVFVDVSNLYAACRLAILVEWEQVHAASTRVVRATRRDGPRAAHEAVGVELQRAPLRRDRV